jgi:hypothetical protein
MMPRDLRLFDEWQKGKIHKPDTEKTVVPVFAGPD